MHEPTFERSYYSNGRSAFRWVTMTPELAKETLTVERWKGQRRLRPTNVAALAAAVRSGELVDIVVQFAVLPDGRRFLIDGYHRLTTIVETDTPLPCIEITWFEPDEESIERRYLTIDRHARRGPDDMLVGMGVLERTSLNTTLLRKLGPAALMVHSQFSSDYKRKGLSLLVRRDALDAFLVAGEMYADMIQGATGEVSRLLWRSPVVAVALATIQKSADGRAYSFWSGIAHDSGLMADDPRKVLLTWLRANTLKAARGGEIEYARYVARAWNAWHQGRSISKLQGPKSTGTATLHILGTPYQVG